MYTMNVPYISCVIDTLFFTEAVLNAENDIKFTTPLPTAAEGDDCLIADITHSTLCSSNLVF